MTYRVLPEHLHSLANATIKYFHSEYGLKGEKIEQEIHPNVEYRPTFRWVMPDKSFLCVEVAENPCPPELRSFILSCKNNCVPARLWVAIQKGLLPALGTKEIGFARENGIGILEVDPNGSGIELVNSPLSLSLTGVRAIKVSDFPAKYREPLKNAHNTFCNGNPSKGCSMIYDEIENLTRRITKKCNQSSFLRKTVNFNIEKESWATVLEFLKANLDISKAKCPDLKPTLFNRLVGLTEYRNDSGHKPVSTARMIERDKQLRTRFESAVDELYSLIIASTPLRP